MNKSSFIFTCANHNSSRNMRTQINLILDALLAIVLLFITGT